MSRTGPFALQFATVGYASARAVDDSKTIPDAPDESAQRGRDFGTAGRLSPARTRGGATARPFSTRKRNETTGGRYPHG